MKASHKKVFVGLLRTAAMTVDEARKLVASNRSVFSRLGYLAVELRATADGFEGTIDAKA